MSQYIKGLAVRFFENLRKTWLLGAVLFVCAVAFVLFSAKDNGEGVVDNPAAAMVGVQSVSKIDWSFDVAEDEKSSPAFETKVASAKETLDTMNRWVSSGNFYYQVNENLKQKELGELTGADYYSIAIASYNTVEILVVGTDADRVVAVELAIREVLEDFMKKGYQISAWNVASEPVELVAVPGGTGYVLTNQVYVESPETGVEETPVVETGRKLLTLSNIVIVASSIVLWCAIVVLLTIADNRVYSMDELKGMEVVCYGETGNEEENRTLCSLVNKKMQNDKLSALHTLVLDQKEMLPIFVNKYEEIYEEKVSVSNWKKDAVDKINKEDTVLLAIKKGDFRIEEIEKCLKMLQVVEVKCIGCILY